MPLETIILFVITELAFVLSPGPAVWLVVSRSMARGAGAGFRANLGIAAANLMFYVLSAAGVTAIILASHTLFMVIKWLGAAYLVWMGLGMLRSAWAGEQNIALEKKPVQKGRDFLHGFVIQASNPKNLVAFIAIFPQFIDPEGDIALQFAILAVITFALEIPILAAYGLAAERAVQFGKGGVRRAIETIGGGWLVAAGIGLAFWRRTS